MNDKFDELARGLAQSVTRRQALRRFGLGLAGMTLTWLGLANKAKADALCNSVADGTLCGPPGSGYACCKGKCVNLLNDKQNCGWCGYACTSHGVCVSGSCDYSNKHSHCC